MLISGVAAPVNVCDPGPHITRSGSHYIAEATHLGCHHAGWCSKRMYDKSAVASRRHCRYQGMERQSAVPHACSQCSDQSSEKQRQQCQHQALCTLAELWHCPPVPVLELSGLVIMRR